MRLCALICSILLLCSMANAATWHVAQAGGGETASPTIQAAVAKAQPGDTVIIHAGVYREAVQVKVNGTKEAPIVIAGAPNEEVVITGADGLPADKWEKLPDRQGVWRYAPWTYRGCGWNRFMAHPGDEKHKLIGRTEQVILDGKLLRQVLQAEELTPGAFCADPLQSKALYLCLPEGDAPSKHTIEASLRPVLMNITGSNIVVRRLVFHHACNPAQTGALNIEGDGNVVEDCLVEWTNGCGAGLGGERNIARRLVSRFNGQMGMGGHGADNLMEECRLVGNNVKGYSKMWEAGGIKVSLSRRFRIARCIAEKNDGCGFWFDIDNRDEIVEGCYSAENNGAGIFIEISETATVRNNLCVRNGLKEERGAWNSVGISLGESMSCVVEHNVCVGNRSGISIRQQGLRALKSDPSHDRPEEKRYYSQGHVIRQNISAFNRDWQFVLFGDNPFFGLHPSIPIEKQPPPPPEVMALFDPAQRQWRMDHNLYFAAAGAKGLICWGAPWMPKHQEYKDLPAFQRDHHLEDGSIVADPQFVDRPSGDFDLLPASPARPIGAGFTQAPAEANGGRP